MKVNPNSFFNHINNSKNIKSTEDNNIKKTSTAEDTLTISSSKQFSSTSFQSLLKSKLTQEVSNGVSEEKVSSLKDQIARGQYEIDCASIAKKMLNI